MNRNTRACMRYRVYYLRKPFSNITDLQQLPWLLSYPYALFVRFRLRDFVMAMLFATGCGIHLHNAEDAELAKTASTTFGEAKLTEAVKAEFDANAAILKEEVVAVQRQSIARR